VYISRITSYISRITHHAIYIAWCVFLLSACRFPGAVQPTVKIGLVAPFEGRYRYIGYDVIYAVRLAVREVNAAGGVGGYSVELIAYDDGADPAMAVEQARKLAADPDVVAAMGHFCEETTGAAWSAYAEAGIPLVAPAVLDPALTDAVASALLLRLDAREQYRAALVTAGGALGTALQSLAPSHRVQVGPVVSPERAGWLDRVMASGADVVLCDADPVTAGEVIAALRSADWQGTFLGGPELAASDFAAVAGEAAQGAVFVTPWPFPTDAPGNANFVESYRAVSNGAPPGPLALPAYEAAWTLLDALERDIAAHSKPTRAGMGTALNAVERSDAPLYWYYMGAGGVPELVGDG
jgi:branched-chain amino acid transport system substrate-binding protein